MGELRYFPGSEPGASPARGGSTPDGSTRDESTRSGSRSDEPTWAEPAGAEPAWTVPGIDPVSRPADRAADRSDEPRPAVPALDPVGSGPVRPGRGGRRAENVSMAALTSHALSESEMRTRLAARGLEPDDVETEVTRLLGSGLLDDAALADTLIDRLRDRKGLGDAALRPALRARGIPSHVLDAALAEASDDEETTHQRLREVAEDRARRLGGLAPAVAERRLLAYLARKGYSGSDARAAARAALAGDSLV